MRRLLAILATGILGMTLFATVASAATVDLQGRIHAGGAGLAHFNGGGSLEGRLAAGVIIVKGDPARVDVEGYGRKYRIDDGFVYEGARGQIRIVGRDLDITLAGAGAELHAAGNWDVILHGHGRYTTSEGERGVWSGQPLHIDGDVDDGITEGLEE
jgi:hypothetical protein